MPAFDRAYVPLRRLLASTPRRSSPVHHFSYLDGYLNDGKWISEIFTIPGFRFEFLSLDFMHVVDLGVAQYCVGNIMFELFLELGGLVTKPDLALGKLLFLLKMASKTLGNKDPPIGTLTIGMIKPDGKPPRFKVCACKLLKHKMVPRRGPSWEMQRVRPNGLSPAGRACCNSHLRPRLRTKSILFKWFTAIGESGRDETHCSCSDFHA